MIQFSNRNQKFISSSEKETKTIAGYSLEIVMAKNRKAAIVVALEGKLGAGKTRFVQGAAKYMQTDRNVTSPTFVLMKKYNVPNMACPYQIRYFYHLDCYRVNSSEEILDIGWQSIISNPANIVFVEWAEKIKDILPKNSVLVTIKEKGKNKREISLNI